MRLPNPSRRAAGVLAAFAALGASPPLPAAPYRVELVAFAREDNDAIPEDPARLGCLDQARPLGPENAAAGELPRALPAAQHLLTKEAEALRRRGSGFRLLMHAAWEQDIGEAKAGPWLRLPTGPQHAGCVRATLKKLPEVEIVLSYLPDAEEQYRVQLKRQVRPGDVQYLDHPAVGMLLRLDPLGTEPGAAPPSAPTPTPPQATGAPPSSGGLPGVIPPPPKKPFRW
jgi:hypothetical protein